MTEEQRLKHNAYTLEAYYWYKEHHICVQCKQKPSAPERVRCLECLKKDAERNRSRSKKMRAKNSHV